MRKKGEVFRKFGKIFIRRGTFYQAGSCFRPAAEVEIASSLRSSQ
jgi:hypothetical protein